MKPASTSLSVQLVARGIDNGVAQFLFLAIIIVPGNESGSSIFSTSLFQPHRIPIFSVNFSSRDFP